MAIAFIIFIEVIVCVTSLWCGHCVEKNVSKVTSLVGGLVFWLESFFSFVLCFE